MRSKRVLAPLLFLLLVSTASGQYGSIRTRRGSSPKTTAAPGATQNPAGTFHGTLKQLTNKEIVIQNPDDQTVVIRRSKKTKFFVDGKEVKASAVALNTPVSVDAAEDIDLKPTALTLTSEAAAKKP